MRVLIAGPLPPTTAGLSAALREAGAMVLRCAPEDAVASARIDEVDLVLLDPLAARGASWRAVGALRRAGLDLGIVLLTASEPAVEQVETWLETVDDCVPGPTDPRIVVAHLRAVDRRRRGHATAKLEVRGVSIDPATGDVAVWSQALRVPPRPRAILRALLMHAGTVLTRERLVNVVYGESGGPETAEKIVDTMLCRLRQTLTLAGASRDFIETVRGEGFVIRREPAVPSIPFQPNPIGRYRASTAGEHAGEAA